MITAEGVRVGNGVVMGAGEDRENESDPHIYRDGLVTLGEGSVIPDGVRIGKNVMIFGETDLSDYPGGTLAGGRTLTKP